MIDDIKKYKVAGMTHKEIAKSLKISTKTIWKILKEHGDIRPQQKDINHSLFSDINNEHSAYCLGLIMADGYIDTKRNVLAITLNEHDVETLLFIKSKLNSTLPLNAAHTYNETKYLRLQINSKAIVSDLVNLGCVSRKTYANSQFPSIDGNYIRHFIRGYFDGDGHISMNQYKTGKYTRMCYIFNILLQENYVKYFKKYFSDCLGIHLNIYRKRECKNNLFILQTSSKKNIYKIYHHLYDNSTIYMKRKYLSWQNIISSISQTPQY